MGKSVQIPSQSDITSEQIILSPENDGIDGIPAISHSLYKTNWQALPMHTHRDCIELCFCSRGSLVFECEDKSYKLMPGQLFVTQPKDFHHLITNPKGLFLYWMFFRIPPKGGTVLGLPSDESAALVKSMKNLPHRLFSASADIRSLFAELFNIYDSKLTPSQRRLEFRTTLLRLLNRIVASAKKETPISADRRLYAMAQEIRKDPRKKRFVPDLASKACMSESVFNARFKKLTGYPPHAFITKCRLDAIAQLLEQDDNSISILAREFGYHSPQHLAGQFKSAFGMTMREWRSSHPQKHITSPAVRGGDSRQ